MQSTFCVLFTVAGKLPVYSVNAHDEGLYIWVLGAAEFAARLRTEGRPVTECEMVQRTDGRAVGHHCQHTHRLNLSRFLQKY